MKCDFCGKEEEVINLYETTEGKKMCENCVSASAFEQCIECGRIITDGKEYEHKHGYICNDCWIGLTDKIYEEWYQSIHC